MDENLTPAMKQYHDFKNQYKDAILLFRMGDFYETFENDAELVSRELGITLTSRSKNKDGTGIPLAGVPYHSIDTYLNKLIKKGYRVAICEQVEDPKNARGVVKRDVVRVVTPGTVIDSGILTSAGNNYLMALCPDVKNENFGISFLDITTGEFTTSQVQDSEPAYENVLSQFARFRPPECIVPSYIDKNLLKKLKEYGTSITEYDDRHFDPAAAGRILLDNFKTTTLEGFGCASFPLAVGAAGAALSYTKETQKCAMEHINNLSTYSTSGYMVLDAITLRNLEIITNIRENSEDSTLISVIDNTKTPMGSRLIRKFAVNPLMSPDEIKKRLDAVEFFYKNAGIRSDIRQLFKKIGDIERITGRIMYGNATARDLVSLKNSLITISDVRKLFLGLENMPSVVFENLPDPSAYEEVIRITELSIKDDPPASMKEGNMIREGYNADLDRLRQVSVSGKDWIAELQKMEREKTGIRSLKVGYNGVFGYYIEVTKSNLDLVPPYFERKQTTANAERFTIPELKEKEALVLNADERRVTLELELFRQIVSSIAGSCGGLQKTAKNVAYLDVFSGLAEIAVNYGYVRPAVDESNRINIRDGRHPIVELKMPGAYVPNDTLLDGEENQILIITGANMAGKSTFMRQVALICVLAQMGSFVPASYASIGIIDRIFTRVGAFDDLARGQSTFMVEMIELANILNNVTQRSLVILDEIGRGTSTLDGFSLAKAVVKYLHGKSKSGARTLFSTHFHELTGIESELIRVKNYHFAVKESGHEVVFLRKIIPGATDKSYGIHVARMAGVPVKIIEQAKAIMKELENREYSASNRQNIPKYTQMMLFDSPSIESNHPVIERLKSINIDEITPMEALNTLYKLQKLANGN